MSSNNSTNSRAVSKKPVVVARPVAKPGQVRYHKSKYSQIGGVAPDHVQDIMVSQGVDPVKDFVAYWVVPDQIRSKAKCSERLMPCWFIPFCWFGCVCAAVSCNNQRLKGRVVILCRDKLIINQQTNCGGCYNSGKDVRIEPLHRVLSVTCNRKASGCGQCWSYDHVRIQLQGVMGYGDNLHQAFALVHADDPELCATTIRKQLDIATGAPPQSVLGNPAVSSEPTQIIVNTEPVAGGAKSSKQDVITQIKELRDLVDCGALEEEEYQQKKKELLKRI